VRACSNKQAEEPDREEDLSASVFRVEPSEVFGYRLKLLKAFYNVRCNFHFS